MEFTYQGQNRKWISASMNMEKESQKLRQASQDYIDNIKYWEDKLIVSGNQEEQPITLEEMLSHPNSEPSDPDPVEDLEEQDEEEDEEYARKLFAAVGGESFFKPRLPNVKKNTVVILERDEWMDSVHKKIQRQYNKKMLKFQKKESVKPRHTLCRQIPLIPPINENQTVSPELQDLLEFRRQFILKIKNKIISEDSEQQSEGISKTVNSTEKNQKKKSTEVEQREPTVDGTTGDDFELGEQSPVHTENGDEVGSTTGTENQEDPLDKEKNMVKEKVLSMDAETRDNFRTVLRSLKHLSLDRARDQELALARERGDHILNPIEKLISNLELKGSKSENKAKSKTMV